MTTRRVSLDTLVFDPDVWPRVVRDDQRVEHLADLLRAGQTLPPIKVQKGTSIVLGGWHTAAACRLVGESTYVVEIVDVLPADRLLYAYREDVSAALPYSEADTRSVARRLYVQRCTDGQLPEVTAIAKDIGRTRQMVDRWLIDLVTDRQAVLAQSRAARIVAVQAFRATGLSTRRIETILGMSHTQVVRDAHLGITDHLTDSRIVTDAHSLIHLALKDGATTAEMEAARDWLLAQTDPDALKQRESRRVWLTVASELRDFCQHLPANLPACEWPGRDAVREEIREAIKSIETYVQQVKERIE